MKKSLILLTAILLLSSANIFAAKVTYKNTSGYTVDTAAITDLQNELNASDSPIAFIGDNNDFARGMADSTKFMSSTATLNSFINYRLFAVTAGFGVAIVAPADSEPDKLQDELEDEGDIYAGVSSGVALNIGLNTGLFVDRTYVNVLVGGIPETELDEFNSTFSQKLFGANLTYALFKPVGIGLFKWRGLALGAGFYYSASEIKYAVDIEEVTASGGPDTLIVEPDGDIISTVETYKIPIEVSTAFQALWIFNVGLGTGVDISWGTSTLDVDMDTDVISAGGAAPAGTKVGELKLRDEDSSSEPTVFQPKIMASLGFNLGPVKLDMPVVYYPGEDSPGVFAGVTAGFVF